MDVSRFILWMIGSTSSASNEHKVVDDNNNSYWTMVMDAIRMNYGHGSQCLIIDKKNLM
jgi:hypothetical protein